jgi:hypothetical protein
LLQDDDDDVDDDDDDDDCIKMKCFRHLGYPLSLFLVVLVTVPPIGTKVRGIIPGRGRCIFKGDKIPQHTFLRRGSKVVGPTSQDFTACKKSLRSMNKDNSSAKFIVSFALFFLFFR